MECPCGSHAQVKLLITTGMIRPTESVVMANIMNIRNVSHLMAVKLYLDD
jgi:hypothetical protein